MIKKNLTRGLQFACGVAVVAAAVGATIHTNNTVAAASTPTGVCGLMMSKNSYGFQAKSCPTNADSCSNDTATLLGTVNFNNGTANLSLQEIQYAGNPNAYTTTGSVAFTTVSVGSALASGAYQVTMSNANDSGSFLFLPTNNNNTYLVTSNDHQTSANGGAPWTGVCQVQ